VAAFLSVKGSAAERDGVLAPAAACV